MKTSKLGRPKFLLPIHLDRWSNPIASKMREAAIRIPDVDFCSFAGPLTDEDRQLAPKLWANPNVHAISRSDLLLQRFDAVHHASATPRNLLAALTVRARGVGRPLHVFTVSVELHRGDPYYPWVILSLRIADRLLAVSQTVAGSVETKSGRKVDAVVPNGVDLDFFSPQRARPIDRSWGMQDPIVLFVGAMLPRKRPDFVFHLARRNPDIQFVMAGRPSLHAGGRGYISEADRLPNVLYLGLVEKSLVRDLLAAARVLLFPSDIEGLGNVALEASAMGLPVLAQPVSSMVEVIKDDTNGWLLPIRDVAAWEGKLRETLRWTESTRKAFATGSRAFVAERYSWDAAAAKLGAFYRQAIATKGGT